MVLPSASFSVCSAPATPVPVPPTSGPLCWVMLCNRYGWFILICFAVAAPIAWLFGNQTLKYFAERASINWWIFPISLLVVGGIMLGMVVLQGWLAARKNPAATIKTE